MQKKKMKKKQQRSVYRPSEKQLAAILLPPEYPLLLKGNFAHNIRTHNCESLYGLPVMFDKCAKGKMERWVVKWCSSACSSCLV